MFYRINIGLFLLFCISISAQNIRTGSLIDLVYMSDTLSFDSKRIGFGGSYSADDFDLFGNYNYLNKPNSNSFNLGYYRYYIPTKDNPHNFILLNSVSFNYGAEDYNILGNEKHFDIYSYKRSAGIGYKLSNFIVVPFTSRSTLNYNSDNLKFDGRKREIGIQLNILNFVGLSFSYNNTIFGEDQGFLRKVASRGIESLGNKLFDMGVEYIFPNNNYYPIYYWLANIAYKVLFININRNNYNFPFNNPKQFEMSSYDLSLRFELNLFN
ncbi:MAG: hypothetical protein R3250_11795 [Melioribacteraceae bacterium]|nr:hypothetical protein [Melioribacteraceae bacterium]